MTDLVIARSSAKMSPPSTLKKLFDLLRGALLDADAKRPLGTPPDDFARDVGLSRGRGAMPGDHDSRSAANLLEIEDLRRRLF